jgi:AbrB family looped-hinge helix DNA binding protein
VEEGQALPGGSLHHLAEGRRHKGQCLRHPRRPAYHLADRYSAQILNRIPFYYKARQEVEAVLKARVSSRGQLALPKEVRDQLGLGEGTSVTVRVEGDEVILRKVVAGNWREWEGRLRGSDLLGDLARSRRKELTRDRKRS